MKRDWENLNPSAFLANFESGNEKKINKGNQIQRRGIQRYVVVVVDGSSSMLSRDMSPTRTEHVKNCLQVFISSYFENNPISQLQIITARDGVANSISPLCGNPQLHLLNLEKCISASGDLSLKVALTTAITSLRNTPPSGTREIIMIVGSLSTFDTGSIQSTIKSLKKNNIVCSIIGLAAEMYVCGQICKETQGDYRVIRNEAHFSTLLNEHLHPPKIFDLKQKEGLQKSTFIQIGFPELKLNPNESGICFCHKKVQVPPYYICPRCKSVQCEIPNNCNICSLTLISASDLSHSYHYLFPLQKYDEVQIISPNNDVVQELELFDTHTSKRSACYSCQIDLLHQASKCPNCNSLFCYDCDFFFHDVLFNCPGCE